MIPGPGRCLAIIPARGGSRRIPRKNIKPFLGRPIIEYVIETVHGSGLFGEVMVSTDDDEIAGLAQRMGAAVPFRRSRSTSGDFATTSDVLIEVLSTYLDAGVSFEYACCCYPTAPFVSPSQLREAHALLLAESPDLVFPVARYSSPILRSLSMEAGMLRYNWPEHKLARSQDLPPAFYDAGQFYFFRTAPFLESGLLFTDRTMGIEVPETAVQDIDSEEDWVLAELKYSRLRSRNG